MRKIIFELQRFATINGTAGNDTINNTVSGAVINGGAGNDMITNSGSSSTIYGGDGSDTISNTSIASDVLINAGGYLNKIYNYAARVTIGGSYSYNDHIDNFGNDVLISGGKYIGNEGNNVTIYGGGYRTDINNYGSNVTIYGGDEIYNWTGSNVKINGDYSDNRIFNGDYGIDVTGVTIDGGDGNDLITSCSRGGNVYYLSGGTDTVEGYNENDTIYVSNSFYYATAKSGSDFVIGVGDDSLILKDCANVKIKVRNSAGSVQTLNGSASRVITGTEIFNTNSNVTIAGDADANGITNCGANVTINGGSGDDRIDNYRGENAKINGGDGYDDIFNCSSSVMIDGGDDGDWINNYGSTLIENVTIDGGAGNDVIYSKGSHQSINGGAGDDEITVYGGDSSHGGNTIAGGTGNDNIYMNSATTVGNVYQYNSGDGYDTIFHLSSYDTIAIGGGSYSTQISGFNVIIQVGTGSITVVDAIYNGLNIQGADDTLPAGLSISGGVLSIGSTFDGDSIRASDYDVSKVDATALSRGIKIWGGNAADCILGGSGNDTIHGSNGADTIFGNAGNDSLSGGNGADVLYGGAGADKLLGGNGNDTLWGGAGNDTLTGSNGADVFVYESGNDLITDYRAGYDKIKIASGSITGSSISGSNVILTTSGGSLTVKNGRGKNLTVIDASGNETTRKYFNSGISAMLFADDNFIGGGANLDAITESKSAVTEIENPVQEPTQIYQSSIIASAKSTTA